MQFFLDESGQGAAEYILLFGGVIVIVMAALIIYQDYIKTATSPFNAATDANGVRSNINSRS